MFEEKLVLPKNALIINKDEMSYVEGGGNSTSTSIKKVFR